MRVLVTVYLHDCRNHRLLANDTVTIHGLANNIQFAKTAVILPFHDCLEKESMNITTDSAVSDLVFDNFLKPYFADRYIPLHLGDIVSIEENRLKGSRNSKTNVSSNRQLEFKVMSLLGDQEEELSFGVIGPDTEIVYEGETLDRELYDTRELDLKKRSELGAYKYSSIGGYSKQLSEIRDLVDIALRFPEVYASVGVTAPKGILLCGPSGAGKTLVAKTIAAETNTHLVTINGPEIMSRVSGESEGNLKRLFEEAKNNAPSILFIDELDSIAAKRDKNGSGDVEKRIVSQLASLMDELNSDPSMKNVVVLAASSKPNSIDPSLRRFGRFEKEITLNVPDAAGRQDILRIRTEKMKMASGVELHSIGKETHGYVGGDLAQLVSEAGYDAIHEKSKDLTRLLRDPVIKSDTLLLDQDGSEVLAQEFLDSLNVNNRNFKNAMKKTNPVSLRENVVEIPNVSWESIGGLEGVKQELYETIRYPLQYGPLYEKFAMNPSRGVLFYGPPGCGKTMLAKAVANECGANFISIKGPELLTMWFGESEANVRDIFDKARAAAPCILFFDELDSIAKARGNALNGGSDVADRVINQILTEIDGIGSSSNKNVFIIGATNRPDVLDSAITRPGRLDQLVYIPLPDAGSRMKIFEANLKKTPLGDDININTLVNQTDGFSGADITEICQRAVKLAIREIVVGNVGDNIDMDTLNRAKLYQRHLVEALASARKSVGSVDLQRYADFADSMKVRLPNDLLDPITETKVNTCISKESGEGNTANAGNVVSGGGTTLDADSEFPDFGFE